MIYFFIAYFIGFAIYHIVNRPETKQKVRESEPLRVEVIYKSPIDKGQYVDFEEIK